MTNLSKDNVEVNGAISRIEPEYGVNEPIEVVQTADGTWYEMRHNGKDGTHCRVLIRKQGTQDWLKTRLVSRREGRVFIPYLSGIEELLDRERFN